MVMALSPRLHDFSGYPHSDLKTGETITHLATIFISTLVEGKSLVSG